MRKGRMTVMIFILSATTLFGQTAQASSGKGPLALGAAVAGLSLLTGAIFEIPQPDANESYIGYSAGEFNTFDDADKSTEFGLEFRPGVQVWRVKPMVGIFATTDAGVGTYFGISHDLYIGKHIVFNFNAAATFYNAGRGKILGSNTLFRSEIGLGYRFNPNPRKPV